MVKIIGPLHSTTATGSLNNSITFSSHKGKQVARVKKNPAQPQSINRQQAQNDFQVTGKACWWISVANLEHSEPGSSIHRYLRDNHPEGYSWQAWLTMKMIGKQGATMRATHNEWLSYNDETRAAIEEQAASYVPPIPSAPQYDQAKRPIASISGGEIWLCIDRAVSG